MQQAAEPGAPAELRPSKIIAVHLNYASRAAERGRTPAVPSYFLKPPSSLSGHGADVARPRGCEYLNFEGEIALVVGRRATRVGLDDALAHVGAYTAANDFGVYDLRAADLGSNLRSKGQDGFTPIGPTLVPASEVDPAALTLRTYVNGRLAQEATTADLLFSFAYLIADLSRLVTLEPGDVILTGTPAGSRPVEPGDLVEVEVEGVGRLANSIVEAPADLADIGAMPAAGPTARAAALGTPAHRTVELSPEAVEALRNVSTATLTAQLLKRGLRTTFLQGLRPTRPDLRMVGYAFTLRWVPMREDVSKPKAGSVNAQRHAVETIGEEDVLVMDARNELGAATLGDILAMRVARRGAAGVVTDGCFRDSPAFGSIDIPAYYRAPHASVASILHHPLDLNVPIACAGVLVMPGDVLVGDAEGVVVIPAAMAEEVAHDAFEQELVEAFAFERVSEGEPTVGVYPLAEERRPEYERWKAERLGTKVEANDGHDSTQESRGLARPGRTGGQA